MWGILILKCKKTSLKHVALRGGGLAFSGGEEADVLLRGLWGWRWSVQREGQAHSPTKSGWDSAVLEGSMSVQL